jgi:hypothetical protein
VLRMRDESQDPNAAFRQHEARLRGSHWYSRQFRRRSKDLPQLICGQGGEGSSLLALQTYPLQIDQVRMVTAKSNPTPKLEVDAIAELLLCTGLMLLRRSYLPFADGGRETLLV